MKKIMTHFPFFLFWLIIFLLLMAGILDGRIDVIFVVLLFAGFCTMSYFILKKIFLKKKNNKMRREEEQQAELQREHDKREALQKKHEQEVQQKQYITAHIGDLINELLKQNKLYSFDLSKTLQAYVHEQQLTKFDRQVVIQKIDEEHLSIKKLLLSEKHTMIERGIVPQEYLLSEYINLNKIRSYHQDFIQELLQINSLGITDPVERLYKKKIAEEDYNDIRNSHFSVIEELTTLFFASRTQDDELTPVSEVSNDEFY